MKQDITFNIYVLSYKRPDKIITKHQLSYCTYVVREEEADAYRAAGVDDLLVIPKDATLKCGVKPFHFMSTFWWLLENSPEDVLFVADDDITSFDYLFHTEQQHLNEKYPETYREIATAEIERIAQILVDLNLGLGYNTPGANLIKADTPFKFVGTPGGARWVNKAAFKAVYDPNDWATSDVDMAMQELLRNRIVLVPHYFTANNILYVNKGGSKWANEERRQLALELKNKWGRYIDFNEKKNYYKQKVKR